MVSGANRRPSFFLVSGFSFSFKILLFAVGLYLKMEYSSSVNHDASHFSGLFHGRRAGLYDVKRAVADIAVTALFMEPAVRIELATFSLRMKCSTD